MLRPRDVIRSADRSAQCGFVCHFQVHLLGVSRRPGTFLRPFRTGPFGAVQPCVVRFLNCLGRPSCIPPSLTVPTTFPTSCHGPAHHPAVSFPNSSFSSKDVLLSLAHMSFSNKAHIQYSMIVRDSIFASFFCDRCFENHVFSFEGT